MAKQKQTITSTLKRAVATAMEASGQSLNEFAAAAGLEPASLSRFLTGQRDLSLQSIEKLCHHLQLELTSKRPKSRARKS